MDVQGAWKGAKVAILSVLDEDLGDSDIEHLYELRNRYSIDKDLLIESFEGVIEDRNGVQVDLATWQGSLGHRFEKYGQATLLLDEGVLYFSDQKVFQKVKRYYGGMYDVKEVVAERHHRLSLRLRYQKKQRDMVDLERVGVIPGSVVVTKNNERLDPKHYTVSAAGQIFFQPSAGIHSSSIIRVQYEYEPYGYGRGYDRANVILRGAWLFGGADNYIGATFLSSIEQVAMDGVTLGNEPRSQLMGGVDLRMNVLDMWSGLHHEAHALFLETEVALSIYNPNRKNKALVHSIEGEDYSYSLTMDSQEHYYTVNPQLEAEGRQLGKSYYIDFSRYSIFGGRRSLQFSHQNEQRMRETKSTVGLTHRLDVNFKDFTNKGGPYTVFEEGSRSRDLYPDQHALVIDYDFREADVGKGYVSYLSVVAAKGKSRNFGEFNSLEVIYKLVSAANEEGSLLASPETVGMFFEVGVLSEDLDRDGRLDEETFAGDVDGFEFNYSGEDGRILRTRIGGSHEGGGEGSIRRYGNDKKDSEDLNGNGQLEGLSAGEERLHRYPEDSASEIAR